MKFLFLQRFLAVLALVIGITLRSMESLAQAPEASREEIRASWCHLASSQA
jgi:hypothetical protein